MTDESLGSHHETIAVFEVTEEQLESSHGYGRVVLTFGHGIATIDGTRFYEPGEYELRRVTEADKGEYEDD